MEKKKPSTNKVLLYTLIALVLIIGDVLLLWVSTNQAKTVKLLKSELITLSQEEKIVASSNDIYNRYQSEVEVISSVFPDESELPEFVETLETLLAGTTTDYALKFNAITPIKEQDKLFLPLTITMKIDYTKLDSFLTSLETLPYMTHVTQMSGKTPDGFLGSSEVSISLKVYVQNPFTNS